MPIAEEKKKESDDDSVKDAWDAESSEDEAETKAEPEPVSPVKEQKRPSPEDDKEVCLFQQKTKQFPKYLLLLHFGLTYECQSTLDVDLPCV